MTQFFFPLLFLTYSGEPDLVENKIFKLAKRQWQTSTFDLATLASRHKLHLPYQVMDVMLYNCNLELCIQADTIEEAIELLYTILLCMSIDGTSPTISPFATTHSINDYSGINSRDSDLLKTKLPEKLQTGITSNTTTVEAWPVQLVFHCQLLQGKTQINQASFLLAAKRALLWHDLEKKYPVLKVVRDAGQSAPSLTSKDQSLLHIWSALEALFPRVSTEVSFRIALYLTQLLPSGSRQQLFKKIRNAYNLRSRVAHGSYRSISITEWGEAWEILMNAANAVLIRGALPTEDDLLNEILASKDNSESAA